jgi:hypothetical protein
MTGMLSAESAILLKFKPVRMFFLILGGTVINSVAFRALKLDRFTHN